MTRLNVAAPNALETHEGAAAWAHMTAEQALRRSVMSCMLWEGEFYEDGQEIAKRISTLSNTVPAEVLAAMAVEARKDFHLRHAPLLLLTALAKRGSGSSLVSKTMAEVISRTDEMAEFLAIYAKMNGVTPSTLKPKISAQVKKGLAAAFGKFDAYQLAKYDREGPIKLRDVLFLSHAKPEGDEQKALWDKVISGTLESADTWEVGLSGGADKKETFERLIREGKLGYLALLRNLRNMAQAGCNEDLITAAIRARRGAHNVLPFRYVAAVRACPQFAPALDDALRACIGEMPKLHGTTVVLCDVSGSMNVPISMKSDLARMDAAAALSAVVPSESLRIFSFSNAIVEVPAYGGLAEIEMIKNSQAHSGTDLGAAVLFINEKVKHDRLIVVSDEQTATRVPNPVVKLAYMVNVASNKNGIGYGPWVHIDGFSEAIFRFITKYEQEQSA